MNDDELPFWSGMKRDDGAEIVRVESGAFAVKLAGGGAAILACPCCDKRALTVRSAKLIADYCYPRE